MPNEDDLLPVLDHAAMEEQLQDPELVRDVLTLLLKDMDGSLVDLQTLLQAGDAPKTARLAHRLKGSFQAVVASRAIKVAARLEALAKAGDLDQMVGAGRDLASEMERLRAVVDESLSQASAGR